MIPKHSATPAPVSIDIMSQYRNNAGYAGHGELPDIALPGQDPIQKLRAPMVFGREIWSEIKFAT